MTLAVPAPSTAAAGGKQTATTWNTDVRDAVLYLLALQGGAGRRNVLTNSHMDVWQRYLGSTFTIASTTKTYTADRWCVYRAAAGSTVTRATGPTGQAYGLRYQRDSGNASTVAMQIIQAVTSENTAKLAGQTCSLRLNLQAGANYSPTSSLVGITVTWGTGTNQDPTAAWTGTTDAYSGTQAITTTATDYTIDGIVIPSTATQVKVVLTMTPTGTASTNDWVQLNAGQLTVGSMSSYERLPLEAITAECLAYYQRIAPDTGGAATEYIATGLNTTTTTAVIVLPYTLKRSAPVVTFSATNDFGLLNASGAGVNTTNMSTTVASPYAARLVATTASGLVAGNATILTTSQDVVNAAILIDSEL